MDTVDLTNPWFLASVLAIILQPTFWNLVCHWFQVLRIIIARREYRTRFMTKFFGSKHRAAFAMAVIIVTGGIIRNLIWEQAMAEQDKWELLENMPYRFEISVIILIVGVTLVAASTYQLGLTCTFLGDYFDIYLDAPATGFPFNLLNDPMYVGTTLNFFAGAISKSSLPGLILSFLVGFVFWIALKFEGPFTNEIYAKKARDSAKTK